MIYDCFTFFNELELLEIRLNELQHVVDKFVIVEATKTHQGEPKPLYFDLNKHRFQAFIHKIIHVIVDEYPVNKNNNSWVYERHQRDMIKNGLTSCNPNDVIIVSDIDEIPSPSKIEEYKNKNGVKIFRQKMFYYFLNCMNAKDKISDRTDIWFGSAMVHFKNFTSAQDLRHICIKTMNRQNYPFRLFTWKLLKSKIKFKPLVFIENGGWHFSYLGGVERIIKKIQAFAHTEYNKEEYKNPEKIKAAIEQGEDIFGRDIRYHFVPIDNSFPNYIQQKKEVLSDFIHL